MNRHVKHYSLALACWLAGTFGAVLGQTLAPAFGTNYQLVVLGSVPNVPGPYGGLIFPASDPGRLLIGGASALPDGRLYSVQVQRDTNGHVVGFQGSATVFAAAPFNEGGLAYAANGVLLVARSDNAIGEIKPGSSGLDKVVALDGPGVTNSPGGLNYVPVGFPGAGQFKLLGSADAEFYTAAVEPDSSGTIDLTSVGSEAQLPYYYSLFSSHSREPEAFLYLPPGKPGLTDYRTMLVCETDSGKGLTCDGAVAVYELDDDGAPVPGTRREFITSVEPKGATIDPVTGDLLVSTFSCGPFSGTSNSVIAVRGGAAIPTRTISLSGDLAFGSVAVGAVVQRTLTIANLGNTTLTISHIAYPDGFSGDWSGTISAGGSHNVTVTFAPSAAVNYGGNLTVNSDATGGSGSIIISGTGVSTDTEGPVLAVLSPVNGATMSNPSLTVSGTASDSGRGNHGIASVTVNGVSATGGNATGANTANWSAAITLNPGPNTITVVARDTLDNPTVEQVNVTLPPPPVLSLNPARVTNDYTGAVQLHVSNLTNGQTVRVDLFLDLANNGVVEPEDPLYQSYSITDGVVPVIDGVTNVNLPFDQDGTVNGQITMNLPSHGDFGLDRVSGNYLCRVYDPSDGFTPAVTSFRIDPAVYPQGVAGTLLDSATATPVAGAVVALIDLSGVFGSASSLDLSQALLASSAFTDSLGRYTNSCPPGFYLPLALRVGYYSILPINDLFALLSAVIEVKPGQWMSHATTVTPGDRTIAGQLTRAGSATGLPGIPLFGIGQSTNGLEFAFGFTDAQGFFQMPVGAGQWSLMLPPLALARLGCVAVTNFPAIDTSAGSASDLNIAVPPANSLIFGRLISTTGTPLAGVRVDAFSSTSTNCYTSTFTDASGRYVLGVFAGEWELRLNSQAIDALGYEGQVVSVTVSDSPTVLKDVTFQPIPVPAPGALTWHWQNPLPQGNDLRSVANGDGMFVAVGDHGAILHSREGTQWELAASPTAVPLNAVIYGNGRFVAVGDEDRSNRGAGLVLASTNGADWQQIDSKIFGPLQAVAYGTNTFVAVGDNGITTSPDGIQWEPQPVTASTAGLRAVASGNGVFVVGGDSGVILTSSDGHDWTVPLSGDTNYVASLAFAKGIFVAGLEYSGYVLTSTNGLSWTSHPAEADQPFALIGSQGTFWRASHSGGIATSTNGLDWNSEALPEPVDRFAFSALAEADGTLVAVGAAGAIAYSQDGTNWLAASSGLLTPFSDVAFGQGRFVAANNQGSILVSTDGSAWTRVHSWSGLDSASFTRLMYAGGIFFATSSAGAAASLDGLHWWRDEPLAAVSPNAIIYANGDFLAVGEHGVFLSADGLQWQAPTPGLTNALVGLAYGNGIFIVCDDSTFWISSDAANWTLVYQVDPGTNVRDLAFANGRFVAVTADGTALVSADGTNWATAATPPTGHVQRLVTAAGTILAAGDSLSASADGLHWTTVRSGVPALHGITYGNRHFLAVGDNGAVLSSDTFSDDSPVILAQPQSHTVAPGLPLTLSVNAQSSLPLSYQWRKDGQPIPGSNSPTLTLPAVRAEDAGRYTVSISNGSASVMSDPAQVLVAATGLILSPLQSWRQMPGVQLGANDFYSIASGWSDEFDGASAAVVAVGDNGTIFTSVNNGPWVKQFSGTTNALTGVTFGRDQFVAVGDAGTILTSGSGTFWQQYNSGTSELLNRVAFGEGLFVAVGASGTILTSTNGFQWIQHDAGAPSYLEGATIGTVNSRLLAVVVGDEGTLLTSTNGSDWTRHDLGLSNDLLGVGFCAGQFIVVGTEGTILTSPDGVVWQRQASPVQSDLWSVAYGGGFFVAVGSGGTLVTSSDGVNWTQWLVDTAVTCYEVTYANGVFWTVGESGALLASDPLVYLRWLSFPDALMGLQGPGGRFYRIEATDRLRVSNDWTWQTVWYLPSNSPPETSLVLPNLSSPKQQFLRATLMP